VLAAGSRCAKESGSDESGCALAAALASWAAKPASRVASRGDGVDLLTFLERTGGAITNVLSQPRKTSMGAFAGKEEIEARYVARTPQGRIGRPEEATDGAVWLFYAAAPVVGRIGSTES
jgi:hypothetical protein